MVNRSMQQKLLKKKRRGRFARFSGSSAKHVSGERVKTFIKVEEIDDHTTRSKPLEVYVGEISLSKQVPKGKGPDPERMASYYARLQSLTKTDPKTLAEVLGLVKDKRYALIWWETPAINRINLAQTHTGRLDLFFCGSLWFFVDVDFKKGIIRRSRDHGSRRMAMSKLESCSIQWVEQFPIEVPAV